MQLPPPSSLSAATNDFAIEVLTSLLSLFDAKIQCHGAHSALLKEISMRVKERVATKWEQ